MLRNKPIINYAYDWVLYYLLSLETEIKFYFDIQAINYFRIHDTNFSQNRDKLSKIKEVNLVYRYIDNLNVNKDLRFLNEMKINT